LKKSRPKGKDRNSIPNEDIVKEEFIYRLQWHRNRAHLGFIPKYDTGKPIDEEQKKNVKTNKKGVVIKE